MPCSSPSRPEPPAADALWARLETAARRLGAGPQAGVFEGIFRSTFARPRSDPAYRTNWLQPGALPLEWSFSEFDPDALRIEIQPFDCEMGGEERLRRTIEAVAPMLAGRLGPDAAERFAALAGGPAACRRFGAFLGLALRPFSPPGLKIYLEADGAAASSAPPAWRVGGAVPCFRSVTLGAGGVAERHYLLCRDGLHLLDLEPLCAALGLSHRVPGLLATILELTDGVFDLSPRSVLLGIRPGPEDAELKVELVAGLAFAPEDAMGRVERLIQPQAVPALRRWARLVQPAAPEALTLAIVSVRASAERPPSLNIYAPEPSSAR